MPHKVRLRQEAECVAGGRGSTFFNARTFVQPLKNRLRDNMLVLEVAP
jgi:hypothetical protein